VDGTEIRRRREGIGLTQQELAAYFNLSLSAVYRWEKGTLSMGRKHVAKMRQVLGIYERHQQRLQQELAALA